MPFLHDWYLFLVSNSVSGTTTVKWDSDGNMFTVQASSSTIRNVLNYIEENSDYIFVYDEDVQSYLGKQVNISLENKKIDKVLDELFAETSLSYAKNGRQVMVSRKNSTTSVKQQGSQFTD